MDIARVKLFKDVELYTGQTKQKLQSAQAKLLVAYCIETQDSLSRSALATLFWPDRSESDGLKLLRNLLNRISKALPNLLEVDRYSVQVIKADNSFDTLDVQELSKSKSVEDWQRAVSLYSGTFLENFPQKYVPESLEEWLELRRQYYQHHYVNSLHKLVHALSDTSDPQRKDFELAMVYSEAWQKEEPDNERIYIHQLSLLAQQHKYEELEQKYTKIVSLPLTEASRNSVSSYYKSLEIPKPQDRLISVVKNTDLASKVTFGRDRDIQRVTDLLKQHRLVTLIGIGGIGKTHITQDIIARNNSNFEDGVVFVSLALTDESQLFNHLMRTLGIYRSGSHNPKEEIIKGLRSKKLLLVLDNAEHLTSELAPFVSSLINQSSFVRCLVSSRNKLSIAPEQVYPLNDLGVPESNSSLEALEKMPTAQLLLQKAQSNGYDLSFSQDDKETIIKLCQISHGLPLAIEIVAANLKIASLEALADQSLYLTKEITYTKTKEAYAQSYNGVFSANSLANLSGPIKSTSQAGEKIDVDILKKLRAGSKQLTSKGSSRRKIPRLRSKARRTGLQHDSLKNCFEYSWSLLEEKHQKILIKQACFFGGFNFKAFTEITGGNAYDIAVLVNTSLIRKSPSGRYERHPLIYQYCREKLKELPELKEEMEAKHAEFYARYALELQEYFDNYKPDTAVRLEPEVNNFLRAIRYSVSNNDPEMIEALILTLINFLATQGRYQEAIDHCKSLVLLNKSGNQNPIIDFFLYLWITFFHSQSGNISDAKHYLEHLDKLLTLLQTDADAQKSLAPYLKDIPYILGIYELVKGMHLDNQSLYQQAQPHFEQVIELQKPFLERHSNTTSLLARNRLAFEHVYLGNFEKAKVLFEENLAHGNYFLQPLDTICLGELLMHQKDSQAETVLIRGLELSQQKNMPLIQGIAHQYLGIYYADKNTQQALEHLTQALTLAKEMAEYRIASYTLASGFGQLYINTQEWLKAQACLYESLEFAILCSGKLRMLSALLRLASIELQLADVSGDYKKRALEYLKLVRKHPAGHIVDKQRADELLAQHAKGQIEPYSWSPEQFKSYEDNRNNKLLETTLNLLKE